MNSQFRIPSFGDELFDLSDIGTDEIVPINENITIHNDSNYTYQQSSGQQNIIESTQVNTHMDINNTAYNNLYSINDESCVSTTALNNNNNIGIMQSADNNATGTLSVASNITTSLQEGMVGETIMPNNGVIATNCNESNDIISEPAKPLSAYALFFRDTVSAIKQENPDCSFQELSRIVSSMWDVLDPSHKNVYNKRNEIARNDYIKQMKIYRQQQLGQQKLQQQQQVEQIAHHQNNTVIINDVANITTYTNHGVGYEQSNINSEKNNCTLAQEKQYVTQTYDQQQQPIQQNVMTNENTISMQVQYQQQLQQQQTAANFNMCNNNNNNNNNINNHNAATSAITTTAQGPVNNQLINESIASTQLCTRENCNKRSIVHPDWEDEYCSNECVVIHCRTVFNTWIQSNLQAKKMQQQRLQQQQQQEL